MANFIGQDGFIWWIGIVEDIDDPLTLGRCKVRCFGYHPAKSTNLVPTEDLPWAVSIHPLNTPNLYGSPRVGDWVFGFFLDALSAQEPAMLGYLPAIPETASEYFGAKSTSTRSFDNAITKNKEGVIWDVNKFYIIMPTEEDADTKMTIKSEDKDIQIKFKNVYINSVKEKIKLTTVEDDLSLSSGKDLKLIDKKYSTTLTEIMDRLKKLEEKDVSQDNEIAVAKTLPVANI
jgi:hypothetical protein